MKKYYATIKNSSKCIRLLGALRIKATDINEAHKIASKYAIPYREGNRQPYVKVIAL